MEYSIPDLDIFDELDSTNEHLKQKVAQGLKLPEGYTILAHEQKNGRGLGNNIWISEAGKNLTFSIYLEPRFIKPENQFVLNMAVSIAMFEYVVRIAGTERTRIKWPNDIYIDNKKVAGLLIQHTISGKQITNTIVGVGLNVNQTHFPESLPNPVSLKQVKGTPFDLMKELEIARKLILDVYASVKVLTYHELKRKYTEALFGKNEKRFYRYQGQNIRGEITGINSFGFLLLQTDELGEIACDLKELEFLI